VLNLLKQLPAASLTYLFVHATTMSVVEHISGPRAVMYLGKKIVELTDRKPCIAIRTPLHQRLMSASHP